MAIQAIGRIGARSDRRCDLLSRAAVTGVAGTMRRAHDLGPGRHIMTGAAGDPTRQVAATQANSMAMI